jgi:hypothetical protein
MLYGAQDVRDGVFLSNTRYKFLSMLAISVIVASIAFSNIRLAKADADPSYSFQGLIDEDSGIFLGPVNVTAVFSSGYGYSNQNFTVNGNYTFTSPVVPLYFLYDLGYIHREFWLKSSETGIGNIFLFNSSRLLLNIQIVFRDQVGSLDNYSLVYAAKYVNGISYIVERRYLDTNKAVIMALEYGTNYYVSLSDSLPYYSFGQVSISSNPIYLLVTGLQFPQSIILSYQYVRIYANRVFASPTGSISVSYQDVLNKTTQVSYQLSYLNGTVAYSATIVGSSLFVDTFSGAANNTDYVLQATIYHSQFGVFTWNQYFARGFSTAPFGLDFLGTWPFPSSSLIPIFLILFAFGSFSMLNAYMGAFFGSVTAITLSYLGWIPITGGALVTAMGFAVLIGITAAKRRLWT